jgi:hypothetical protein
MPDSTKTINQKIRTGHKLTIKRYVRNIYNIYKDNWCYIILQELRKQVSQETYDEFRFLITQEVNLLKRVVNDLSTIYHKPAKRRAVTEGKEANDEGELIETQKEDENYEKSQEETNKDDALNAVNQYTNLTNNVMLKVTYRNEKLDYDIYLFDNVEIYVDPEDWKEIIAVKYYHGLNVDGSGSDYDHYGCGYSSLGYSSYWPVMKYDDNEDGIGTTGVQDYYSAVVWTKKDIKNTGIIENGKDNETLEGGKVYTVKPYGDEREEIVEVKDNPYIDDDGEYVLPFVLFNRIYPVYTLLDFTSGNDLKDLTVNIAILLVWLNSVEKYQSFKQIVINTDDPDSIPKNITFGPNDVIVNPTKEGGGSVEVLDLQADITNKFNVIKERIVNVLSGYGISPQNFTMSASPTSGFALKISNIGKLEYRESQLPMYRQKEKELYDIEKVIWNYHKPSEKIDEDAKLETDFSEVEFPKSPDEKIKKDEFDLRHNQTTEVKILQRDNPDLTEDMSKEMYMENKTFNEANAFQPVQMNPIQQPGTNNAQKNNQGPQANQSQRGQQGTGRNQGQGSNQGQGFKQA